ncbi:hypothetical protein CWE09_02210 [Aliidiomarina minuta]|uniref:PD-(D/E)XK nuclease family protein n=1 Tax=Aliidiomarina minuta TaxID=880057 RepID=A0A432W6G0_9GAMM|nr:PD-(D/E)XK nuclease family protein [Aliidiomarina minuta]RUO25569.1 hypothetical protein CWE09_02210 [Aliidiomarina minuta]
MDQEDKTLASNNLEALLINLLDDNDFQALSDMEERFNIFDALGTRRQELRHSDFLSYILDPGRPHGLGDKLLRDFLLEVTEDAETVIPDVFHGVPLRLDPLNDTQVYREYMHIDILLRMPGKWLVLIENKIGASEHGGQLTKYETQIETHLDNLPALLIYLTPSGSPASQPDWIPVSYTLVHRLVKKWAIASSTPNDVKNALSNYADYLEGHVLEDSKVAELCRSIYKRHKQAIDILNEHIPTPKDFYLDLAQKVMNLLEKENRIVLDSKYRKVNRFYDPRLKKLLPEIDESASWTRSGKGILFEWEIGAGHLRLDLVIGPVSETDRKRIFQYLESSEYQAQLTGQVEGLKIVSRIGKRWAHYTQTPIIAFEQIYEDIELEDTRELVNTLKAKVETILEAHYSVLSEVLSDDPALHSESP